ncbi:MAG: hypothetical protein ABSD62_11840 [Candidatus Limnocylindrales bacterium]|jgi:hypothetical protein
MAWLTKGEGSLSGSGAPAIARVEDWLLAGWVGLAWPVLVHSGGSAGPFESDHPVQGLLLMAGFCGAIACLATRNSDGAAAPANGADPGSDTAIAGSDGFTPGSGVLSSAAVGPLVGGLLLVGGSAFAELGLNPETVFGPTLIAVVAFTLLQAKLPAIPTTVRRALVTPYAMAAGGLFWSVVLEVTRGIDFGAMFEGASAAGISSAVGLAIGALTACAAVYYAMLIYAPRQIAEREGGPIVWLIRFGLFLASVALGLGWLSLLGG